MQDDIPMPPSHGCIVFHTPNEPSRIRWPMPNSIRNNGIPSNINITKNGIRNAPISTISTEKKGKKIHIYQEIPCSLVNNEIFVIRKHNQVQIGCSIIQFIFYYIKFCVVSYVWLVCSFMRLLKCIRTNSFELLWSKGNPNFIRFQHWISNNNCNSILLVRTTKKTMCCLKIITTYPTIDWDNARISAHVFYRRAKCTN